MHHANIVQCNANELTKSFGVVNQFYYIHYEHFNIQVNHLATLPMIFFFFIIIILEKLVYFTLLVFVHIVCVKYINVIL